LLKRLSFFFIQNDQDFNNQNRGNWTRSGGDALQKLSNLSPNLYRLFNKRGLTPYVYFYMIDIKCTLMVGRVAQAALSFYIFIKSKLSWSGYDCAMTES
jgi:hypothetical protein